MTYYISRDWVGPNLDRKRYSRFWIVGVVLVLMFVVGLYFMSEARKEARQKCLEGHTEAECKLIME